MAPDVHLVDGATFPGGGGPNMTPSGGPLAGSSRAGRDGSGSATGSPGAQGAEELGAGDRAVRRQAPRRDPAQHSPVARLHAGARADRAVRLHGAGGAGGERRRQGRPRQRPAVRAAAVLDHDVPVRRARPLHPLVPPRRTDLRLAGGNDLRNGPGLSHVWRRAAALRRLRGAGVRAHHLHRDHGAAAEPGGLGRAERGVQEVRPAGRVRRDQARIAAGARPDRGPCGQAGG